MLYAPRNTDDGDAEQQAETDVNEGDLPPSKENPKKIHNNGQAARIVRAADDIVSERPEGVGAEFEELHAERNADDGDAHQQAIEVVQDGCNQAAEQQPKNIAEKFH